MNTALQLKHTEVPSISRRIAELRAGHIAEPMRALLDEASDPQAVVDELGAALQVPVVRVSDLAAWQAGSPSR